MKSNAQREQLLKLGSNIADLSEMCIQRGEWDRLLFSCAAVKNIWGPILQLFGIDRPVGNWWADFNWTMRNIANKKMDFGLCAKMGSVILYFLTHGRRGI